MFNNFTVKQQPAAEHKWYVHNIARNAVKIMFAICIPIYVFRMEKESFKEMLFRR